MKVKAMENVEQEYKNDSIAVLTGDIVRSTDLSDAMYEDLLYTLHNQLTLICNYHSSNRFEVTRGDSFQVILHNSENAAKYALLIRTSLKSRNKSFDCRISIGVGHNAAIRHSIGNSTGDAFTLSGRALDIMSSDTLKVSTLNNNFNEHFALLTKYVDQQISEMTQRQCAIMYIVLKKVGALTQGEIAEMLGANRVSINRSMKSANLALIDEYTILFSKKIKEFFQ